MPAYVLETDGGARGNPGPAGSAYILRDPDGQVVAAAGRFLGVATNNVAEYQALVDGLEAAMARGVRTIRVRSDSELVVRQLAGEYRVKNEGLRPYFERARELLGAFAEAHVGHVRREHNAEADALANRAMDAGADVGWPPAEEPSQTGETPVAAAAAAPARQQATLFDDRGGRGAWDLTVKGHFDAAHALRGYQGECRELHGHTWDVEVTVRGDALDGVGIVYDFKTLKADLAAVLEPFDHAYLNEVAPFDSLNATAENLARVVFEALEERVGVQVRVIEVAVWESPVARIAYRRH